MSDAPSDPRLDDSAPVESHRPTVGGLVEVASAFLRLGCLSFGGPIAHLGHLRAEFVEKRKWLDDAHYGDLVALCQFLPGPASSQVVFALGMQRAGLVGALVASACFTLPSALLMIAFAYGVGRASDLSGAGWLHGLKLAAVAVVAQAVWGMGKKLCTDRSRVSLCFGSAALLIAVPGAIAQLGAIAVGGLVGWWRYRDTIAIGSSPGARSGGRGQVAGATALVAFVGLLVALPALASATRSYHLAVFDSFYRSGALVLGGGHVVLPLLRAEIVPRAWLTDDQFLVGYGAAQALPGPLFAFSAYLGAAMNPGSRSWLNGLWCLLGIFLPAWLLIGGRSRSGTGCVRRARRGRRSPAQTPRSSAYCSRRSTTRSSRRACADRATSSRRWSPSGSSSSGRCHHGWWSRPARRPASGCSAYEKRWTDAAPFIVAYR